jgi:MoxR-like ATPase
MTASPSALRTALAGHNYVADEGLSTSVFLALKMGKALFLEGEPGVGKTEIAKVLAALHETDLIRLQCYEGIDLAQALYEWNYPRQLLEMQGKNGHAPNIYSEAFLLKRPLLSAIDPARTRAPVLLIDELDRADEEFESFLLELLSDFQITIPELGTVRATHRPMVVITSNRTREVHDALKRRCVYCWIDYPTPEVERDILLRKLPGIDVALAGQIVGVTQALRKQELYKAPGVAETLDWAQALMHLSLKEVNPAALQRTLGLLLKYQDDVNKISAQADALLGGATR